MKGNLKRSMSKRRLAAAGLLAAPYLAWWFGIWQPASPYWAKNQSYWVNRGPDGSLVARVAPPPSAISAIAEDTDIVVASFETRHSTWLPESWSQWRVLAKFVPSPIVDERWDLLVYPGRMGNTDPEEVRRAIVNALEPGFAPLANSAILGPQAWIGDHSRVRLSGRGLLNGAVMAAFAISIGLLAVAMYRRVVVGRRRARGACLNCGYLLSENSERCPECGCVSREAGGSGSDSASGTSGQADTN